MRDFWILATRNVHKVREISALFPYPIEGIPEGEDFVIEENGLTCEENARLKAVSFSKRCPERWVLADDSGLEVQALRGEPGVYSARFAGRGATASQNNALLLQRLAAVPPGQRQARFCCVLVVAQGGQVVATFEGELKGWIAMQARGHEGFGYDPLFIPEGQPQGVQLTLGEWTKEEKNRISHRAQAMARLVHWASQQ